MKEKTDDIQKDKSNRNIKLLELLVTYPPFIKEILEIRRKLKIPENGFKKEEDVEKWQIDQIKEQDMFMESDRMARIQNQISVNLKSEQIEKSMANKQIKIITDESPINFFSNSIDELIRRFKLPANHKMTLRIYILYGKLTWIPENNFSFRIDKEKTVFEIYSRLTKEEMGTLVKYIRIFNKRLPHIIKVSSKTKTQLHVEKSLNMENSTGEKITAHDLAKEYLNNEYAVQKIYDAKRNLERKRKRKFG
jgi:hypothetical protein